MRSIFSKMMTIYITVLLISLSVTGSVLFYSINRYMIDDKQEYMGIYGQRVTELLQIYLDNQNIPAAVLFFQNSLKIAGQNTGSIIWIVDEQGFIVAASEIPDYTADRLTKSNGFYKLPDERQYQVEQKGNQAYLSETGNYFGLFTQTNMEWLTVKIPFNFESYSVSGVVLMHTPIPEIRKTGTAIFRLFILAGSIASIISVFLLYFFSKKFSDPLKKMSHAAKVISSGKFTERLGLSSRDEIGQLAESFNQMVDSLENLENMRREFVANVSHELRTPMTSIKGFIEGILDGTIPVERQNDYLRIVRDEVGRLNRLVNELLNLAKMEAGEIKLDLDEFDINELIRLCVIKMERYIVEKELEFKADFEREKIYVLADADSIQQVLINLLHNSIKFTPSGGRVSISTRIERGKVEIAVQDTGEGIDKHEQKYVFERFHKADKSRSKDRTGVGLGLAIVKNIILLHHESIWIESEKGKGTRFVFTLSSSEREWSLGPS